MSTAAHITAVQYQGAGTAAHIAHIAHIAAVQYQGAGTAVLRSDAMARAVGKMAATGSSFWESLGSNANLLPQDAFLDRLPVI